MAFAGHFALYVMVLGFCEGHELSKKSLEEISEIISENEKAVITFFGEDEQMRRFLDIVKVSQEESDHYLLIEEGADATHLDRQLLNHMNNNKIEEMDVVVFYADRESRKKAETFVGSVHSLCHSSLRVDYFRMKMSAYPPEESFLTQIIKKFFLL